MSSIDDRLLGKQRLYEILYNFAQEKDKFDDRKSKIVTFVNPYSYHLLNTKSTLKNIDFFFSDGVLLTALHSLKYPSRSISRASFDYGSIANDVFEFAASNNFSVCLIGAGVDEIDIAKERISNMTPGLHISFHHHGYFDIDDEAFYNKFSKNLSDSDIIIIGLGAPLQENFAIKIKSIFDNKLIFTCGGFLTQTSIKNYYYPHFINRFNLRWLYRLLHHKHVRKKFFATYPRFLFNYFFKSRV